MYNCGPYLVGLTIALAVTGCASDGNADTAAAAATEGASGTVNEPSGGGMSDADGLATTEPGTTTNASGSTSSNPPQLCGDAPQRVIFFGDSIFDCFGVGGQDSDTCAPFIAHKYVNDVYGEGVVSYENLAQSGSVTSNVIDNQLPNYQAAPGRALVIIWVGGNDLQPFLLSSDANAQSGYDNLAPELDADWATFFAFIDDPNLFPDGVDVIVNTQFNPFDDCNNTAPFAFMTETKSGLLGQFNTRLKERAAQRDNTYVGDEHTTFLGHGHHNATDSCPNYIPDADYWMLGGTDLVHPNALGHFQIANTLQSAIDEIYSCD